MNLEALLARLGATTLHCLPNRGNAGDGLIQAGLIQLCQRLGLKLQMIDYPEDHAGKHLLLIGAGCFCPSSWHMVDPVRFYSPRFENVYVLSASFESTFGPVENLLRNLPANVTLFCRERISYGAVVKLVPRPEKVFLDHDLAFQIDVSPWEKKGQGTLNCFRTDTESRIGRIPSPNFDISNMGREYHHTLLLDTLANFESVNTDRLHVAIAAALLGKNVRVFEGVYHKIRGVFEYSLRGKYPRVALCGTSELAVLLAISNERAFRERMIRLILWFPKGEYVRRAYRNYRLWRHGQGDRPT